MTREGWERDKAWERIIVQLDADLVAWLDAEAEKRERSRAWMVNHLCRMYRKQTEARRQRAVRRRKS